MSGKTDQMFAATYFWKLKFPLNFRSHLYPPWWKVCALPVLVVFNQN